MALPEWLGGKINENSTDGINYDCGIHSIAGGCY